ncbi:hypothetical protein PsorP6_009478 [Peronosclerospora sorghi]|uniref:Uncharacterized protein n=1 Tax=Peronosclerospora sorghi TaxID=230839 RepID=A0ACC0VZB3_9STRA|nr:hypothetical protein PsorP6_009478 [Peronosclerospora sorghi]
MASSKLHEKLLRQWDTAARAGLMHTNVNNTRRRCLPGTLGLIVQYNPSHRKKKRPVDPQLLKATTSEPSTTTGFNFTLVKYDSEKKVFFFFRTMVPIDYLLYPGEPKF